MRARVVIGELALDAEIYDTPSGRAVAEILPLEASFNTWGDEFYFSVPMQPLPQEKNASTRMQVGDIGYWPEGNALAIFFGPTPASSGQEPVAYSPVNRVGRVLGDARRLQNAAGAATVRIEPA